MAFCEVTGGWPPSGRKRPPRAAGLGRFRRSRRGAPRANLERDGRATLIAIGGITAHYAKLRVTRSIIGGGALGCRLAVAGHKADSLGIPLWPAGFTATAEIGRLERWQDSRRLLASLDDPQR